MKIRLQNLLFWLAACGLGIAADQYTKLLVVEHLKNQEPIQIIPGVFELIYTENRGAAFGMLQGKQGLFFAIAALVLIAAALTMCYMPGFQEKRFLWMKLCISGISAGAIGNMIDRTHQGFVVDFLYFKLIDFPVFNVADIFVTCAAVLLVYLVIFYYKDEELERIHIMGIQPFSDKKKGENQ